MMTDFAQLQDVVQRSADDIVTAWQERTRVDASARAALCAARYGPDLVDSIARTVGGHDDVSDWALRVLADGAEPDVESLLESMPLLPGAMPGASDMPAAFAARLRDATMRHLSALALAYARKLREAAAVQTREFAQDLSHELKSPLNAARAGIQMVKDPEFGSRPERRDEFLEIAERSLDRAFHSIDDVRRVQRGDVERAPLRRVVGRVIAEMQPLARQSGVAIRVHDIPEDIEIESAAVELALRNLIGNAIKYRDADKSEPRVEVSVASSAASHVVRVRDNGIGIRAADQERIFERWQRVEDAPADGSGLGLAIASDALDGIDGRLTVSSEERIGSTFEIHLPR